MPQPWEIDWTQQQAPQAPPPFIAGQTSPTKQAAEARDETRTGIAVRGEQRDIGNTAFNQTEKLYDNYNALPTIKSYRVAVQELDKALRTGDGPQADLALTYAFAKAMDPDSVVREAEQSMITESQPWFQSVVERTKKQFGMDGAGNYTPQARAALRDQIIKAVSARRKQYSQLRNDAIAKAERYGFNPVDVVGTDDGAAFFEGFKQYDEKRRADASGAPNAKLPLGGGGGDGGGHFYTDPETGEDVIVGSLKNPEAEKIANDYEAKFGKSGAGDLLAQGQMLGLGDEAAGVGGAIAAFVTGNNVKAGYYNNRDAERIRLARARERSGGLGTAAEFAGGASIGGSGAFSSMREAAKGGAALGGLSGFGYGEGLENSTGNALLGATVGAGIGAGAKYAENALTARAANRGNMVGQAGQDVIDAGARQNIAIRRPDVDPSVRGKVGALEKTEKGAPPIKQAIADDTAAIEGRVAEVGGSGSASDPYALGSKVQAAGKRYIDSSRGEAGKLYTAADRAAQGQRVDPQQAVKAAAEAIVELEGQGGNANSALIGYLRGLGEDLSKPGGFSIAEFQGLRSAARAQIKGDSTLTASNAERLLQRINTAFTADATAQLPKAASARLAQADKFYAERMAFINDTLKAFMGNRGNPLPAETAAERLVSMAQGKGNFERFSSMWGKLEPGEQADVAATIAQTLGRKQNGDFSVATLIKSLDPRNGINPRTARMIFGKEGAEALADLRTIANAKVAAGSERNFSNTGNVVTRTAGGLKTALLSVFGLSTGGVAGGVALPVAAKFISDLGEARAARLLMDPNFTKWLKNAPQATNPKAIDSYIARLAIAANDNEALVSALRNAFAQSPGRAAAGEQEQN